MSKEYLAKKKDLNKLSTDIESVSEKVNIQEQSLNNIDNKHTQSISALKEDLNTVDTELQNQINNIVLTASDSGDVAAEVAQARVNVNGENFETLKGRLDAMDATTDDLKSDLNKYTLGYDNNLIDYKTLTPGYIIGFGKHTEPFAYNDYCITEFIPVKSNEYYYLAKTGGFICWYESTDYSTFIADSSNTGNVMRAIMKSPSTAKYAVLSFTYSSRFQNNWTFCEACYYLTTANKLDLISKYDALNTVRGELVWQGSPAGYALANNNYSRSGFIKLSKGFKYKCTGRARTTEGYFISFYTDTKYSAYISTTIIDNKNISEEVLDIPTNANYAIVSMGAGKESEIEFEAISTSEIVSNLTATWFDANRTTDGYIVWMGGGSNAGKPIVNADYFYSDFISVDAFSKYVANGNIPIFVSFYRGTDYSTYINTVTVNAGTSTDATVDIPDTAKYAVISSTINKKSLVYFHKLDVSEILSQTVTTVVTVGENKDFEKLTDAVSYAYSKSNVKIIVYPGVYDLAEEYNLYEETYSGSHGAFIGNNTYLLFMQGAEVVCNYTGNNETINSLLSGLNSGTGNYTIENMKIKCSGIRYCVHDERAGDTAPYIHNYINCDMYMDNTENPNWSSPQCIGGGLGEKGYINVSGGYYKSVGVDVTREGAISWHNGYTGGLSQINIENVCIPESTVRIGYYGPATEKTKVKVCGNKFLVEPILRAENSTSTIVNMEIIAFNNDIGAN